MPASLRAPWRLTLLSAALLTLLLALATGGASVARAEPPLDVDGEITDSAGVLGGETDDVQAAIDRLADETDLQLFVVFVETFDGLDGAGWADATANESGLGTNDLLLAVATEERRYGLSYDTNVALSSSDLDRIESATEDELREDAWAGAAIAAADTTREAAGGSGSGTSPVLVLLLIGAVVVVGVFVVRAFLRRRNGSTGGAQGAGADELSALPTPELDRRASSALVAVDDAMKTSEEELGFAQAQFGLDATGEFAAVLDACTAKVGRAFALRQQLDDDVPETEPVARTMMVQIITLCDEVDDALDEQSETFDELRDLQARAPEVLDATDRRAGEIEGRLDAARATLATLATTYPATALASVSQNPDQAAALLAGARETVAQGRAALTTDDRATAVTLARAAENAVGQAVTLLDAVDRAGSDLAEAGTRLDRAVASITADMADAGRLLPGDPAVAPLVTEAQAAVANAGSVRSGGDPIAALRRLTDAEAALDAALAPHREQAEHAARASALLRETVGRVESQIRATNDFIETRRGAVGPEARTQLSEAIRLLGEARTLAPTDPVTALTHAQQADARAQSATQLAQRDASSWSQQGGGYGTGGGSGGGSNVGGMILGGILLDRMLGGGNRGYGGGYGGGGFSGGGFGGGGFGGGGFGGSSRGGSRSRSRGGSLGSSGRSSGGRSSGGRSSGGRSSRGGRF
ncbi:TPM domain-containing protein [Oerskovia flava]|uniref:TPM domain-containing protein n=1 Tax=Oerskovia flava TaxID=2986422 RepID=UPI00223EDD85|nr:TPM domain-containing protein [Oerskovia sp. JB1-3-2]